MATKTSEYYHGLPYTRHVRLEQDEDDAEYFVASIEELPGVEADGTGPVEAMASLADAFDFYLATMIENDWDIPEPTLWPASVGWNGPAPSPPGTVAANVVDLRGFAVGSVFVLAVDASEEALEELLEPEWTGASTGLVTAGV